MINDFINHRFKLIIIERLLANNLKESAFDLNSIVLFFVDR